MKKLSIGQCVHVDGTANQFPYERIVDDGIVLDNTPQGYLIAKGYLVQLKQHRENLIFKRKDLTIINPVLQ